jgi:ABC-2 type transport system ATP-binding protein
MTYAIVAENLSKIYKTSWGKKKDTLSNINIQIDEGESFGFIGENGAGKSTTIKIIMGLVRATSGSCQIFDHDISSPNSRKHIGYVPESPILPDYLSPFEILEIGNKLHGNKLDKNSILNWLERLGLAQVAKQPLRQFSKGMQQRTALAHALAIAPRMLILDEPMSGLDPSGRQLVSDLLSEYKQNGGTIFFSSHALYDVERLADRYGLIHAGKLIKTDSIVSISDHREYLVTTLGDKALENAKHIAGTRWEAVIAENKISSYLEFALRNEHTLFEVRRNHNIEAWFSENTNTSSPRN